jgi:hypothetical protein
MGRRSWFDELEGLLGRVQRSCYDELKKLLARADRVAALLA